MFAADAACEAVSSGRGRDCAGARLQRHELPPVAGFRPAAAPAQHPLRPVVRLSG